MSEWKRVKLGDVCKFNSGLYSNKDSWQFVNYLDTGNITQNKIENVQFLDLKFAELPSRAKRKICKNTIVYSTVRPIQRHYGFISNNPLENMLVSTGFCVINQTKNVFLKYIYFYLTQNAIVENLQMIAEHTTSTYPAIKSSDLQSLQINLPPLEEQKAIADVLASLDDKIELNNKINKNLEEQAQALFKRWFVDFEFPNKDGNPYKSSGGEMVDSELGSIPKDWEVENLDSFCEVITKGTTPTTLKRQFTNSGINFIKAESITDDHTFDRNKFAYIDEETNKILNRSIIKPYDLLFTIAGTLGRFAFATKHVVPANTNQAVAIIRTNSKKFSPLVLYCFFICGWQKDYYTKNIQQAVQANLSLTTIKTLPILLPKNLDEFAIQIKALFEKIFSNELQNQKLAELRDYLLPKLMSGEIRVKL